MFTEKKCLLTRTKRLRSLISTLPTFLEKTMLFYFPKTISKVRERQALFVHQDAEVPSRCHSAAINHLLSGIIVVSLGFRINYTLYLRIVQSPNFYLKFLVHIPGCQPSTQIMYFLFHILICLLLKNHWLTFISCSKKSYLYGKLSYIQLRCPKYNLNFLTAGMQQIHSQQAMKGLRRRMLTNMILFQF